MKEKIGLYEVCFNLADRSEDALPDLHGRAPRPLRDLRGGGAADVVPIERTNEYRGLYHVLGGALSPSTAWTPRT